jgi:phospholipase C
VRARCLSRRRFVLGAAGVVAAGRPSRAFSFATRERGLPPPARSGLDHIVVVMMENRSFDHLLGWLPGANGRQAGLTYPDRRGVRHATYRLAPDFQGCGHPDPDHSYRGGRVEYANGACDGFLRAGANDVYAIGYYTRADLPFLGRAATAWTACDNSFAAIMGPTIPNRLYLHAGRTDRTTNTFVPTALPTIWDRLAARKIKGRYYQQNISLLTLWGTKYRSITRPYAQFLRDCKRGTLPAVAYVEPSFTVSGVSTGSDDHPHADIRVGEAFLDEVYRTVTASPAWPRTLLVITFDEWGGFFDHVAPSRAPDVEAAHSLRGFRVPCVLVSPFARRGHVAHGLFDHASILRMIEWRFGLRPLTVRDAKANNLAIALDFSRHDVRAPRFDVPRVLTSPAC